VRLVFIDEARRTAEGRDFGRYGFLAVGSGGGHLYRADATAFQKFRQAAKLGGREVLGVNLPPPPAPLVQKLGPFIESQRNRRADPLRMRYLRDELFLRIGGSHDGWQHRQARTASSCRHARSVRVGDGHLVDRSEPAPCLSHSRTPKR